MKWQQNLMQHSHMSQQTRPHTVCHVVPGAKEVGERRQVGEQRAGC